MIVRTADVEVLIRRGLRELAVVLVSQVRLVLSVLLFDVPNPESRDNDWQRKQTTCRLQSAIIYSLTHCQERKRRSW